MARYTYKIENRLRKFVSSALILLGLIIFSMINSAGAGDPFIYALSFIALLSTSGIGLWLYNTTRVPEDILNQPHYIEVSDDGITYQISDPSRHLALNNVFIAWMDIKTVTKRIGGKTPAVLSLETCKPGHKLISVGSDNLKNFDELFNHIVDNWHATGIEIECIKWSFGNKEYRLVEHGCQH